MRVEHLCYCAAGLDKVIFTFKRWSQRTYFQDILGTIFARLEMKKTSLSKNWQTGLK